MLPPDSDDEYAARHADEDDRDPWTTPTFGAAARRTLGPSCGVLLLLFFGLPFVAGVAFLIVRAIG